MGRWGLPSGWEERGQAEAGSVLGRTLREHFGRGFVRRSVSRVVWEVQVAPKRVRVLMALLSPDLLDGSGGCAGEQSHSCSYLAGRHL